MSKKNNKHKSKKNKNSNNNVVEKKETIVKKSKLPVIILVAEVLLAVAMLILIFNKDSFMQLAPFTKDKIVWVIYLIVQAGLAFTILSKKKDDNKWTFHIETMLITLSYLLLG